MERNRVLSWIWNDFPNLFDEKGKVIKKPVKIKQDVSLGIEEAGSSNEEYYISEETPQLFHLDGSEVEESYVFSQVSKKMV